MKMTRLKLGAVSFSFDAEAQYSHFVTGMLIVLGPMAIWHIGPEPGTIVALTFAAAKEIWDVFAETPEVSGGVKGSLKDFLFWAIGVGVANALTLL